MKDGKTSGQSALEYLSSYGVALLVIAIVVGLLLIITLPALSTKGSLYIYLTDAPIGGLDSLKITFSSIEIHKDGEWSVLSNDEKTFDLMQLSGKKTLLGANQFPLGKYTQIRLSISKAEAVVNDQTLSVEVPSEKISLVHSFNVKYASDTYLVLDFAPDSLKKAGEKYILTPVIKVETEEYSEDVDLCLGRVCPIGQECKNGGCTAKINAIYCTEVATGNTIEITADKCFDDLHQQAIGIGQCWGQGMSRLHSAEMKKGEEKTFEHRMYNGQDTRAYYHVELRLEGGNINEFFEYKISPENNCFILEPAYCQNTHCKENCSTNATTKVISVTLKPKVSSGWYRIQVCNVGGLPCDIGSSSCGRIDVTVTG